MGVDGYLAAGFVFAPVSWSITLMADSPSHEFFDGWYEQSRQNVDVYRCNGTIWLRSVNRKFELINGALTTYRMMPDAGRTLRPRAYVITWQSINPSRIS